MEMKEHPNYPGYYIDIEGNIYSKNYKKEHPNYPGYYGTVDGKVFSNRRGYRSSRELNPTIQKNNNGYACLSLYVNKKKYKFIITDL